jgi:hypothetical protein
MKHLNPITNPLAYIFGVPGLLAFFMILGLGLWLATVCLAALAGIAIGLWGRPRVDSALRRWREGPIE